MRSIVNNIDGNDSAPFYASKYFSENQLVQHSKYQHKKVPLSTSFHSNGRTLGSGIR